MNYHNFIISIGKVKAALLLTNGGADANVEAKQKV